MKKPAEPQPVFLTNADQKILVFVMILSRVFFTIVII